MSDDDAPENSGRDQAGRFVPGQSGNVAGKPPGARHAALLALDAIGEAGAKQVMETVVSAAVAGDMRAAELLLRRLWPERRGRPVALNLPPITGTSDIVLALGAITAAVSAGELSPDEGAAVAGVLEMQRRGLEQIDLEARITVLEQAAVGHGR